MQLETIQPNKGTSAKVPRPKFREVTFADYPQIAALESHYGLNPKTYEEWKHLWVNNPAYYKFSDWPIGWVGENEAGQVVGCITNIPLAYEFNGRSLAVATSRSFVVDSPYRAYSLSLLAHFFGQKNIDLFLNTTVNPQALKLQEMFRAARVPTGTWNRSAFWITNYRAFTASLMAKRKIYGAGLLSYPASAGLFLRDQISSKLSRASTHKTRINLCTHFDDSFTVFWDRIRKQNPHRLLAVRSREVMEWHFQYALAKKRAWVLTASNGSEISAYAIFCRQDNPRLELQRMRLVDFQALPGQTELLSPMLAEALGICRSEGIHMIEAIGFSGEKERAIQDARPYFRELASWRYFYRATDLELAANLRKPEAWDPTCFDGDASL